MLEFIKEKKAKEIYKYKGRRDIQSFMLRIIPLELSFFFFSWCSRRRRRRAVKIQKIKREEENKNQCSLFGSTLLFLKFNCLTDF